MDVAVEQQAIARVHRFGQTRDVHIIRFITDNTVEVWLSVLNGMPYESIINGVLAELQVDHARPAEVCTRCSFDLSKLSEFGLLVRSFAGGCVERGRGKAGTAGRAKRRRTGADVRGRDL